MNQVKEGRTGNRDGNLQADKPHRLFKLVRGDDILLGDGIIARVATVVVAGAYATCLVGRHYLCRVVYTVEKVDNHHLSCEMWQLHSGYRLRNAEVVDVSSDVTGCPPFLCS